MRQALQARMRCGVFAVAMLVCGVAGATTYYVDGACATSGTGTVLVCGTNGPMRTISAGITAMHAGDTLNIRGAHGGFDGVYKEYVGIWGTANDGYPGKALACTASQPCIVQGCAASACGQDEMPTITGLVHKADWSSSGSGASTVYARTMEPRSEYIGGDSPGSATNPVQILQGTNLLNLRQLQYQGNNISSPADGFWSFNPTTNVAYVNPIGTADPGTDIWVPDQMGLLTMQGDQGQCPATPNCPESAYVTFRRLTFAGSRWMGVLLWPATPLHYMSGINLDNLIVRYIPRFGLNTYRHQNFTWNNLLIEHGARGVAVNPTGYGGGFALRLSENLNGQVSNVTVRHYGQAGRWQQTNFDYGGIECHWCTPPWNDHDGNFVSSNGNAFDLKWSTGMTVRNITVEDVSFTAVQLDTINSSTVDGFHIAGARIGVRLIDYDAPPFTRVYNVVVRNGYMDTVGFNSGSGGVVVESTQNPATGEFLAKIYNLFISRPSYAGIVLWSNDKLSLWNNTISGVHPYLGGVYPPDGIKILGTLTDLDVRNNVVANIKGADVEVAAGTVASAPRLDRNLYFDNGQRACAARWGTSCDNNGNCTGGTCYASMSAFRAATGREGNGREGDPQFIDAGGTPPNLHIQSGSAARDAGDPLADFDRDADGEPRPYGAGWDVGANEFWPAGSAPPAPPNLVEVEALPQ